MCECICLWEYYKQLSRPHSTLWLPDLGLKITALGNFPLGVTALKEELGCYTFTQGLSKIKRRMFTFEITSQIEPSQYTEISGNTKLNPFCQLVLRLTDQITIYRSTSNQDCILTPNPKLLFFLSEASNKLRTKLGDSSRDTICSGPYSHLWCVLPAEEEERKKEKWTGVKTLWCC